jgi:hypothetical protein
MQSYIDFFGGTAFAAITCAGFTLAFCTTEGKPFDFSMFFEFMVGFAVVYLALYLADIP